MPIEEPVIVSGGSVTITFKDTFETRDAPEGEQQYKLSDGRLLRVLLNGEKLIDLNEGDKVEIVYEV